MNLSPFRIREVATHNVSQPLVDTCIAFAILETLFVIAFILSWHLNKERNSINTKGVYALILFGYVFCFVGVVIGVLKVTIGGAGTHAHTLQPRTVRRMLQLIKAHEVIYVLSIPFPKLAILCLYLRLFTAKLSTSILYATGIIVIGTALFGFISAFSNCRPFHAFWDRTIQAHCTMDIMTAFRFYSIPNIVTDIVMLIIPIPALIRLNVSRVAKVGVALTFLVSALGIVTAVLRFVAFLDVNIFKDITYLSISTTCWSIIEPGVYLIAATVPTLRPLVRRFVNRIPPCSIRSSTHPTTAEETVIDLPRLAAKKSWMKERDDTISGRPSRPLRLDDYHYMRFGSGVFSVRSEDEESMVCADAIVHETMGRQGRNPDGTLQVWSLQPMQFSPLRTSFFFADDRSSRCSR